MRLRSAAAIAAITTITLTSALPPRAAAWTPDGARIAPCDTMEKVPSIATDGAGGFYAAWATRDSIVWNGVKVQHVMAGGATAAGWPIAGLVLPGAGAGQTLLADGAGGVFIATGGSTWYGHVLIHHLGPNGQAVAPWPSGGVSIVIMNGPEPATMTTPATLEGAGPGDIAPSLALDGAGGLLVSFTHVSRSADLVHVLRLTAAGVPAPGWSAGGTIPRPTFDAQLPSVICGDGAGGAFTAWAGGGWGAYASHVLADGTLDARWPQYGLALGDTSACQAPGIVTDGAGGCLVTWLDTDAAGRSRPRLQHLLADGSAAPGWPAGGLTLATVNAEAGAERTYSSVLIPYASISADGGGGALVAWSEIAAGVGRIRVQRVRADGALAPGWPAGGLAASGGGADERLPALVADGAGGAFLAWQRTLNGSREAMVQHVTGFAALAPSWPSDGLLAAPTTGQPLRPCVLAGPGGAALVAWEDGRTGIAQIDATVATPTAVDVPDAMPAVPFTLAPNPTRAVAHIRFRAGTGERIAVTVLDLLGRRVRTLMPPSSPVAGPQDLVWDGRDAAGRPAGGGIYLVRVAQDGRSTVRRLALIR